MARAAVAPPPASAKRPSLAVPIVLTGAILLFVFIMFTVNRPEGNDGPLPPQPSYPSGVKHLRSGFLVCSSVDALRRGNEIQAAADMAAMRRFLEGSNECAPSVAGQMVTADYESYGISKVRAGGSPNFRYVVVEALE